LVKRLHQEQYKERVEKQKLSAITLIGNLVFMSIDKLKRAVLRRKYHVRKKVFGTPDRPRLSVFRSNRNIYAQIIDDVAGVTLVSASTRAKGLRDRLSDGGNIKAAQLVGEAVAKQALKVGIKCCLLYTSPSPRDRTRSRMPSSA